MGICAQLGYVNDLLEPTLTGDRLATATALQTNLAELDTLLQQAVRDSMAVKVSDLTVNYAAHIGQICQQGSRLLAQLSQVAKLAIVYDRFSQVAYAEYNPQDGLYYPTGIQSGQGYFHVSVM